MFLQTALEAARIGGKILKENLSGQKSREISEKQKFDFVTQVDVLAEKAIMAFILEQHPEHNILAEESGGQKTNGFLWVVDPLDGTTNYIHGFPAFAVSVALLHQGQVQVGVILDPLRGELFAAEKGHGASLNDELIQVSQTTDISQCLLGTGFPFRAKHLTMPYFKAFTSMFQEVSDLRRAGAAALDLAYLACGRIDGFWEVGLNLWDIAAGVLLIEEAGGTVSGFLSANDHLETGNIIASNGKIHEQIASHVTRAFQDVRFERAMRE
ncbi:MAG: inositol monophosphatase family protein [bacterium]